MPIVLFGLLALVVGMLGCLTAHKKNACFALPFGALALVIGLILLAIGGAAVAATALFTPEVMR